MGLRAAASAADLVGLRPVTEMVLATALGLLAGEGVVGMVGEEESSASTKEGLRARPNEEGTDGDDYGCGWLWMVVDRRFVCSQVRSRHSPCSLGLCIDGSVHEFLVLMV